MTQTVARLLLSMLLMPMSMGLFVVVFAIQIQPGARAPVGGLVIAWAAVYAFIALGWILIWRSAVNWTLVRSLGTVGAALLSLIGGAAIGALCRVLNPRLPIPVLVLAGGAIVPIVWVLATVLLWRETPRERMARLAALGLRGIHCPICGYALTGLSEARCPECGARFTLDQLFAAQAPGDVDRPAS
jgi:hypothetical protein